MPVMPRQWSFRGLQALTVVAVYAVWLYSQDLLERSRGVVTGIMDHTHDALAAANVFFNAHPTVTNAVLILSSLELDVAALSMVAFFFVRRELRPLLSLWIVLLMRQLCQASVSMPKPEGMIWHYPGFPSIVVTYGASNDFFFSGHMALATLLAAELTVQGAARRKQMVAWGVIGAQALVILSMRFHYVTDVVAGFLAAIVATQFSSAVGRRLDERLRHWLPHADAPVGQPEPLGVAAIAKAEASIPHDLRSPIS
jgi:hypothetical protein